MEFIRNEYINEILEWKDRHFIKIITGVRRCGKSTILEQFRSKLENDHNVSGRNIIKYDFNDKTLTNMTWEELLKEILQKADSRKINYVFLDEIQEINKYENAVITLFENKKIKFDIYLTGSNSKMFSSALATLFTGRNHEIKIYPFSFKEYMMFAKQQIELKDLSKNEIFDSYLNYGGMPIIFELFNNKTIIKKSINDFFIDTLNKDIKKRHAIRGFHKFMRFAKYAVDQDGSIFSTSSISNYLRSNNKDTANHRTIARYLSWLCEALLFYKVDFFNTKGKKILQTSSKYYCVDPSIKNAQNEFNIEDRGRILENIVLIELLRRNYEVTVGKLRHGEIDFVASKGKDRIYIQVASRLDTNKIKKREYGNLQSIRDSYKKIIITEERVNFIDDNGIETVNIVNWLLGENV